MSYSRDRFDDIHIGDHVVMEVVSMANSKVYAYKVSGAVRMYNGVKAVGRDGLGEGRIIEHTPPPLPAAFGSHIQYPNGREWVKVDGEHWRSDAGGWRLNREMPRGWVLIRDAETKA